MKVEIMNVHTWMYNHALRHSLKFTYMYQEINFRYMCNYKEFVVIDFIHVLFILLHRFLLSHPMNQIFQGFIHGNKRTGLLVDSNWTQSFHKSFGRQPCLCKHGCRIAGGRRCFLFFELLGLPIIESCKQRWCNCCNCWMTTKYWRCRTLYGSVEYSFRFGNGQETCGPSG